MRTQERDHIQLHWLQLLAIPAVDGSFSAPLEKASSAIERASTQNSKRRRNGARLPYRFPASSHSSLPIWLRPPAKTCFSEPGCHREGWPTGSGSEDPNRKLPSSLCSFLLLFSV
uniref:Uncharacterized protein LOC105636705 n=1 Tax=Rhizophora mucronata TaxID=61149 RepID=A0A2P2J8D4_RHIMU